METFKFVLLVSSATAQFLFGPSFSGPYKGFHFEYHKSHRVLLVRNFRDCYLIAADNNLENAIEFAGEGQELKADILTQIDSGTGVTNSSVDQIKSDFHDYLALIQCSNHNVFHLAYTVPLPSQSPVAT